jgi:hypothetical protein
LHREILSGDHLSLTRRGTSHAAGQPLAAMHRKTRVASITPKPRAYTCLIKFVQFLLKKNRHGCWAGQRSCFGVRGKSVDAGVGGGEGGVPPPPPEALPEALGNEVGSWSALSEKENASCIWRTVSQVSICHPAGYAQCKHTTINTHTHTKNTPKCKHTQNIPQGMHAPL